MQLYRFLKMHFVIYKIGLENNLHIDLLREVSGEDVNVISNSFPYKS